MARKSGIYGLVQLDKAPLGACDAVTLGLPMPEHGVSCLLAGVDRRSAAVSQVKSSAGQAVLVGEIEEASDLARALNLPAAAAPAVIAQAALAAFGSQLPARMVGEYSFVNVDADGAVTLIQSAALRDPLLYAARPGGLAISPSVFALARLDWVACEIDPVGLAASLGQARTRPLGDNLTILRGVYEVLPGEIVRVAPDGVVTRAAAELFGPVAAFQGTRGDALDAVEALLARIIGARLARTERPAVLLSGGLDSSILAMMMARTAAPGQWLGSITSVAPPGTGLADEWAEAAVVAASLGLNPHQCWPAPDANPYIPRPDLFLARNGPLLSNRHVLTDAMHTVAGEWGATLLINGTYGEGSVTASSDNMPKMTSIDGRLRAIARRILGSLGGTKQQGTGFHVRLHQNLLSPLADRFATPPILPRVVSGENGLLGYRQTALKALPQPNEYAPGALRMDFPFRDLRLLRLFASFPRSFLHSDDGDREFARRLLAGHVPDDISRRRGGRPASPDHLIRLRAFAPETRARIDGWRADGAGDWVDLAWLDAALIKVAHGKATDHAFGTQVQLTAMAAAFFSWWQRSGRMEDH